MVEGETTKPSQRSRRIKIVVLLLIAISIIITLVGGKWYIDHKIRRFYEFSGYANAYRIACNYNGMRGPSLSEIEAAHAASKVDQGVSYLPVYDDYRRPTYRPIAIESDQTFLLFVETKQPGVWLPYRFVIFGKPDGMDMRVEWMSDSEIETAIKDDDTKRQSLNANSL